MSLRSDDHNIFSIARLGGSSQYEQKDVHLQTKWEGEYFKDLTWLLLMSDLNRDKVKALVPKVDISERLQMNNYLVDCSQWHCYIILFV